MQQHSQQERSVKDVAERERDIARRLAELRYLTTDAWAQKQQNSQLGELGLDVDELVEDTVEMLNQPKPSKYAAIEMISRTLRQWLYTGIDRDNLRKHLVNAALLQLGVRLLSMQVGAYRIWLNTSANAPNFRRQARGYTDDFEETLRSAPVTLSALNLRTITLALRSWSDELSISATDISGWLEAAIFVSRDLRYLANVYHTRWLWKSVSDRSQIQKEGLRSRGVILIKAIFDSAFRVLSGYGLRGRRFIGSLIVIVVLFATGFYAVDVLSGCQSWWSVNSWVNFITSTAFLVGDGPTTPDMHANAACPGTGYLFGAIGVTETGVGYLLLGIFVSLLYAVIQRRSIDTSRLALPHLSPSQPASVTNITERESVHIESNTTVQADTQINNVTIDPPRPPDTLSGVDPD